MRYIPEHERDTRWPIWCVLYRCQVPWNQMRTVEEIEGSSYQLSGNAELDMASQTEMRNVQLPIERIAELVDEGARVLIADPWKHARTIYYAIVEHMQAWNSRMTFGINDAKVPREDLRKLDSLANIIHPFLLESMPADFTPGTFANLVRQHGGVDRAALRSQLFEKSTRERIAKANEETRAKVSDRFQAF